MEKVPAPTRRDIIRPLKFLGALVLLGGIVEVRNVWPYGSDAFDFLFPSSVESPRKQPITLDAKDSYTFIGAGNSLAAGYNGIVVDGKPDSWVGPMVRNLNATRRKMLGPPHTGSGSIFPDWQYAFDSLLSKVNSTASDLLRELDNRNTQEKLSSFYQATLCISLGFNELFPLLTSNAFSLVADRHSMLNQYQRNLEEIIASFQAIRRDKGNSAGLLLGLPNLDAVPAVQRTVRGTPLEGRTGMIASEMNQRMAEVCSKSPIPMAYIDLFNGESINSNFVSQDGLHPNALGDEQIGRIAANGLHIVAPDGQKY